MRQSGNDRMGVGQRRHHKQSSVYMDEHQRKKQLFSNQGIFTSNSVVPSSRKKNKLERSVDTIQESSSRQYLPQLQASHAPDTKSFNTKSHSIKPSNLVQGGGVRSSISPSFQLSHVVSDKVSSSNRFTQSNKKQGNHLDALSKNPSKLLSNPSVPTMVTDMKPTPYRDIARSDVTLHGLSAQNNAISRNHAKIKSESDEKLEEWSQIFNLQHNRWQEEFDDVKARFLTDFEKQKMLKQAKPLPKAKPRTNFQIPNEYLSLEKRTVKEGHDGTNERLRRDRIKARKLRRNGSIDTEESERMRPPDLGHNASMMTIQQRANSSLDVGSQKQYVSQRDGDSTFDANTSTLNNSTSLGRILYTKEERLLHPRMKLPSIHKKSLKKLEKNINLLRTSDSAQKLLSHHSHISSVESSNRDGSSVNHYGSVDAIQNLQAQQMNIQDSGSRQREPSNPLRNSAMRIQVNKSSYQSPQQLGEEVRQLFKKHPDSNPFQIMLEREAFDAVNVLHERQQLISKLTAETKSIEQAYLDAELRKVQSKQSVEKLANTINLNINMTINQYGSVEPPSRATEQSSQRQNSMTDLLRNVQVNPNFDTLQPSENIGESSISDLRSEKKRITNTIRISRRKMLEPLKVASKLGSLTQAKPKKQFEEDELDPSLITFKEKMGVQHIQIDQVRQFVDKQIDNEIEKERVKISLLALQDQLEKQGMTLREVVDRHTKELKAKAQKTDVPVSSKLGKAGERSRARFVTRDDSFDFVKILECSASLRPLLQFQHKLKERSKRRHQKLLADKEARKVAGIESEEDQADEEIEEEEPMAHLKKKMPIFRDQDESIAYFIENVKKLIFLNRDIDREMRGVRESQDNNDSDYNWVEEPEMYQSSSGESKYSNEDRDEKDHLSKQEKALMNYMRKYKHADKIVQMNEVQGKDNRTSHLVKYLQEVNNKGFIPKAFGMVYRQGPTNTINANQVLINEEHAKAIANSVGRARYVNKLILRNCGLRDDQAIEIIRNMDKQVVNHLDVSYNPLLSKRFYKELNELLADPACNLERIEIEGNNVGDIVIHDMVEAMVSTKQIVYLNVNKNNISDAGARDLALLVQECPKLRLLFMHMNRIMGFGGVEIAEAVGSSKSLQVLDISFNSICGTGLTKKKEEITEEEQEKKKKEEEKKGKKKKKPKKATIQFEEGTKPAAKGFAELFARGFSESWCEAFASNKSLLHVDMSHNHLGLNDVEIIAEGLKENQQILGIHFAGNDGDVDTQGFVKPGQPLMVGQTQLYARMQDQMQGGVVRDSKALELKACSNCWVCEGWSEHRFVYRPGKSDDNPNHDIFKPIKLHLDIDHFEGDLMMQVDDDGKEYDVFRMLPPGPHRYFYSIDGRPQVAQDQLRTQKKEKHEKKLYLDMSKLVIPKDEEGRGSINSTNNRNTPKDSPKKQTPKGAPKGVRAKEAPPEKEPLPDYYELDLPFVNYIENIAQTKTIFNLAQIEKMNAVPRPGPKGLGNRHKVRTPWDFSLSVFASYKIDTTRLLNDCFEMDWNRTKVTRIVKNDEERERLKSYIRSIYKWFREMYKFTAGSDPMNDIFCIGTNVFSDLIINGVSTLVDNKSLKLTDLDLERIQTNANETNSKFNPKNNLVRHNFLEVFIRLCDTKYLKNKAGGEDVDTITKAFKMMFETELYPWFSKFDSHAWRKSTLWQEDIDFILKQSLDPLKALYKRYIGRNSLPGGQQFMSLTEFTECILASDCLSDNFGAKQIGNQYNLSMMSQVDEIDKDRHINMTFVEFLEAVVRVADKTEIPHCVLDEYTWGVDEVDPDMRESYGRRDLTVKLEALIMFLIRGSLPYSVFQKHLKTVEEFKGAGLYANDLDTGTFNLNQKRV